QENFTESRIEFPSPEDTIRAYARNQGWTEELIGLLTSASMTSYASSIHSEGQLTIEAHLTAGLSNARAAGDTAEYRVIGAPLPNGGTINTILVVHHPVELSGALELLMICAGAKARSLAEAGIRSRLSGVAATGTGTDSTVVLSRPLRVGESAIQYAGMHTLVGELAAKSVMDAMKQSLNRSD
ncbi:MAG: adenosylcobinamide amidohydrolase, partial [Spirochaetaceae bacterium]|nr:adenosylcobinamide amidohydrolase [Spirochaetaceae bacterium]